MLVVAIYFLPLTRWTLLTFIICGTRDAYLFRLDKLCSLLLSSAFRKTFGTHKFALGLLEFLLLLELCLDNFRHFLDGAQWSRWHRNLCRNASLRCRSPFAIFGLSLLDCGLPFLHHFFSKLALFVHPALSDSLSDGLVHHNADCKDDIYDHHVVDDPTDYLASLWDHLRVSSKHQKVLHDQDDCLAHKSLAGVVLSHFEQWVIA